MVWGDGVVDGVAIRKYSIFTGNSQWAKVFERFMEYELEGLKDREDMGTGFGDPFNDTSDVSLSNAYLSGGALRNSSVAPATITLDSYSPAEVLSVVKVKLWLEDLDITGAISCGDSGSDKIEAYLSYNGNSTFSSALDFPDYYVAPAYPGANIYIFTSHNIDVSGVSISGLGLRVQSFARSVAPNFKLHGALVVGR